MAGHVKTLEEQLDAAGLRVFGACEKISAYGPDLLQHAPLLQDMTPAEADILGASMRLIRAEPGQVIIREGDAGEWMLLVLKGTIDVTRRIEHGDEPPNAAPSEHAPPTPKEDDEPRAKDDGPARPEFSRVAVVKRGASIGEMSMFDSELRYASCTAIDTVEAAAIGRHEIAILIRDHPAVGAKLLVKLTQLMAQRLRNTSNQLVKLLRQQSS